MCFVTGNLGEGLGFRVFVALNPKPETLNPLYKLSGTPQFAYRGTTLDFPAEPPSTRKARRSMLLKRVTGPEDLPSGPLFPNTS